MQEEITRQPFNPVCARVVIQKAPGKVTCWLSECQQGQCEALKGLPGTNVTDDDIPEEGRDEKNHKEIRNGTMSKWVNKK